MRGSLVHRGKSRWAIVLDLGYVTDPTTGTRRRKQKWVSVRGTKKEAEDKLTDLMKTTKDHGFIEPSKLTLLEYLRAWLDKAIKPPLRRPETYRVYRHVIEGYVALSPLATMPLRQVRGSDLERHYATINAKAATVALHHVVLHRALKKAVKDRLLVANPAADVENRPRPSKDHAQAARVHCWMAGEARLFLEAARRESPQIAAYCTLALDTGARKSELNGLQWTHIDLDAATVQIEQQLDAPTVPPTFGPTKTHRPRTVALGADTVARLRTHRRTQAELMMKNRTSYEDCGLVFAKEDRDLYKPTARLGHPLATLSGATFARIVKGAGLRPIKFHGLRHTCATLLLQAGVPVHVVAQRLGHTQATMTLNVYAHALPNMQQDAAAKLAGLLANG